MLSPVDLGARVAARDWPLDGVVVVVLASGMRPVGSLVGVGGLARPAWLLERLA